MIFVEGEDLLWFWSNILFPVVFCTDKNNVHWKKSKTCSILKKYAKHQEMLNNSFLRIQTKSKLKTNGSGEKKIKSDEMIEKSEPE